MPWARRPTRFKVCLSGSKHNGDRDMSKRARITLTPETGMEATEEEPQARPKRKPRARPGRKPQTRVKQAAEPKRKPQTRPKREARATPSAETDQENRHGFAAAEGTSQAPPRGEWQTHTSPPPNRQADNGFTAAESQPGMLGSIIRTPAFGVAIKVAAAGLAVVSLVMLWRNRRF